MSASTSPPVTAAILLWRRWFLGILRRPLPAADAPRFMSSEEGGVRSVATGGLRAGRLTRFAAFCGRLADFRAVFFAFLTGFRAGVLLRFFAIEIPFKSLTGLR